MGFTFSAEKKYLINSRLEKRIHELNIESYQEYQKILENEPAETELLFNLLTTNVTQFFRESKQLEVIKLLLTNHQQKIHPHKKNIYCWSAGCSSGEEAYTLAMIFAEILNDRCDFRILASDINIEKLQEGVNGLYPLHKVNDVPKYLRLKYFKYRKDLDLFQIDTWLRVKFLFRKINLNVNFFIPSHISFDFVFCRNVFIYFASSTREKVINRFHQFLNNSGYLVLGACENLNITSDKRWTLLKNSIYQKL